MLPNLGPLLPLSLPTEHRLTLHSQGLRHDTTIQRNRNTTGRPPGVGAARKHPVWIRPLRRVTRRHDRGAKTAYRDREYAFEKLRKLHILYEQTKENKGTVVSLDPIFRKNFRLALTGG